ncbi:hypothetical protein HYH03_009821 [Edaphochlamys debaryana]|uniref:Uncharacterized protein n=1 Tax=Edaphochlamys debaryana TaxID=47281 RepID=A0A835XX66_9CHLO|nr:hypothetical protein HYH03_009821 [Edaphochlamys debaryana]|eukprot:KAG2491868.1 hypothetical protein HYH03_009821 [Edaphochlamys debaryana]
MMCHAGDILVFSDTIPDARPVLQGGCKTPIILQVTNRFDYGIREDDRASYYALMREVAQRPGVWWVANNPYEALHMEQRNVTLPPDRFHVFRPVGVCLLPPAGASPGGNATDPVADPAAGSGIGNTGSSSSGGDATGGSSSSGGSGSSGAGPEGNSTAATAAGSEAAAAGLGWYGEANAGRLAALAASKVAILMPSGAKSLERAFIGPWLHTHNLSAHVQQLGYHYGGPTVLSRYRGVITVPYQTSVMKLYEGLAVGAVFIMPSPLLFSKLLARLGPSYMHFCCRDLLTSQPNDWTKYMDWYSKDYAAAHILYESYEHLRSIILDVEGTAKLVEEKGRIGMAIMARTRAHTLDGFTSLFATVRSAACAADAARAEEHAAAVARRRSEWAARVAAAEAAMPSAPTAPPPRSPGSSSSSGSGASSGSGSGSGSGASVASSSSPAAAAAGSVAAAGVTAAAPPPPPRSPSRPPPPPEPPSRPLEGDALAGETLWMAEALERDRAVAVGSATAMDRIRANAAFEEARGGAEGVAERAGQGAGEGGEGLGEGDEDGDGDGEDYTREAEAAEAEAAEAEAFDDQGEEEGGGGDGEVAADSLDQEEELVEGVGAGGEEEEEEEDYEEGQDGQEDGGALGDVDEGNRRRRR